IRGQKKTMPAIGPSAIFAEDDILMAAPPQLTAAGFGDMLGTPTSLFDWKFGSLVADEPYLQISADITRSALNQCVNGVEQIGKRTEEGVRILMGALVESGLAMLLFGQSHPASGSEHHLSHYWEMEFIRIGEKQLLHGAKVGAACVEISTLYH
ncbi:iron-containing alcohol dehydrogenase, partial [Clostridium perfringens]